MADSKNIWAATIPASGAAISVAPLGTPLPTNSTSPLNAAFVDLGWVGEDGVTNAVKRDVTRHKAWGGETVKTTQDNYTETAKFALLESNVDVLATVFGAENVTINGYEIRADHSSKQLARQVFVIDFTDGDSVGRILLREGLVTEIGDIKYAHKELTMYELTVDVYKPGDGSKAVTVWQYNPHVSPAS